MTRFRADKTWRRPMNGSTVIAGSPVKLFNLTDKGRVVAERIELREEIDATEMALANRFLDAGAVVPILEPTDRAILNEITVVIPVFAREKRDVDALESLISKLVECRALIVVDDHSPHPISGAFAVPSNCQIMRNEWNTGPAGARNAGLAATETKLIAFVDADVHLEVHDLLMLASHLQNQSIVATAPRIIGTPNTNSIFGRFEETDSPLDLGKRPARVRAGTRVSYVPTACLVARTAAVRDEGGFDPELSTGEDVDLVWRLDSPLHWVLYESAVEVTHDARSDFWSWVDQRRGYGRAAASLATRHPGALAPVVANFWSVAIVALLGTKRRWLAIPIVVYTAVSLARKLPSLPNRWFEATRLALLGHWHAGVSIARAITRVWLPLALGAAVFSRTARRILVAASLLPAFVDWLRKRPRLDPIRYVSLRAIDDAAYATGVWEGCAIERTPAPLAPRISKP